MDMPIATLQEVAARQKILERKLGEVLRLLGMSDHDIADIEMDEAIHQGACTLDFTAIKDTLRRRIEQRRIAS